MRDPLQKDKTFISSNRAKWAAILIGCMFVILFVNIYVPTLAVHSYLTFLTTIGSLFILGKSVDSYMQAKAATQKEKN